MALEKALALAREDENRNRVASVLSSLGALHQVLMIKFYELWNPRADGAGSAGAAKGLGAAAALRAAQEHVRSQKAWAHPYYWAAWVLWGLPD